MNSISFITHACILNMWIRYAFVIVCLRLQPYHFITLIVYYCTENTFDDLKTSEGVV